MEDFHARPGYKHDIERAMSKLDSHKLAKVVLKEGRVVIALTFIGSLL